MHLSYKCVVGVVVLLQFSKTMGGLHFHPTLDIPNHVGNHAQGAGQISKPVFPGTSCGASNPHGVGPQTPGLVSGEARFGEYPWMAAILRQEHKKGRPHPVNTYLCGGSLIHPRVVMTAAHCVFGVQFQLTVRLGEWDTQTTHEAFPHQDVLVSKILVHEGFNADDLLNDIALVFLQHDVKLAPNVGTVCLPPLDIPIYPRCIATGWGNDTFRAEHKHVVLKEGALPVVDAKRCQGALRKALRNPTFQLQKSLICAGGEFGPNNCGDFGSPLVCKLQDLETYAQYGMLAWRNGCGETNVPATYTNVQLFVPWIEHHLRSIHEHVN